MQPAPPPDTPPQLGVYVHYPYCSRRCPYCDFNVAVVARTPHTEYREAVLAELAHRAPDFAVFGPSVSLYFGGGTPGLWPAEEIEAVIDGVNTQIGLTEDAEITVEANPGEIQPEGLVALRRAGVNRLSLGTQSFDAETLSRLGRAHGVEDNIRIIEAAQRAGFDSLSLDLIQGVVGQSVADALADVQRALSFGPAHISTYQLTIHSKTAFGARAARGETLTAPEADQLDLYHAVRGALADAGVMPYEISNAGRPGFEARHNSLYWRGGAILALGAGAHGYRPEQGAEGPVGTRWENERHPGRYMQAAHKMPGETWREAIDVTGTLEERLMTGLRLDAGMHPGPEMARRYGRAARGLVDRGWLLIDEVEGQPRWRCTDDGRVLLDTLLGRLLS